ncbi:MAG: hypothetical protein WCD18_06850 [Thermosynechococcaceae cyanobacterium]
MIHILNWGMGVESTAILLRWLLDEGSRDFALSELLVLTAQTGDEFDDTKALVETHILPLLRQNQVRLVEVARNGPTVKDGYIVLQDSRFPVTLHTEGAYTLSENLIAAGTVPRLGRPHLCAIRFKGEVLDAWIADHIHDPFGPYIGYNAEETKRAEKSSDYGCRGETYRYPLIEWGWSRQDCLDYLKQMLGADWEKSCCQYCPFQSKAAAIARYRQQPQAGAFALWIGGLALALNPRMHLFSRGTAYDVCVEGGCHKALELYRQRLEREDFAVYRVRRIYAANGTTKRTTVNARRNVETVGQGNRTQMTDLLAQMGNAQDAELETSGGWLRFYRHRKTPKVYPSYEEFFVVCPDAIRDKCQNPTRFESDWQQLTGAVRQLSLAI